MKHASVDRSKRVSRQCRNHGACPYCRRSRTRNAKRREWVAAQAVASALDDYYGEVEDTFTNYGMNRCYYQFPCVLVKKEPK